MKPAEQPPAVPLTDLDDAAAQVRDWRGKLVVVGFWASWCPPCLKELASLERLAATADPSKVVVVAVSIDPIDAAGIRTLAKRSSFNHIRFLRDPQQRFGSITREGVDRGALPLYGLPTTYVLGPSGAVAGDIVGPTDWSSAAALKLFDYLAGPQGNG